MIVASVRRERRIASAAARRSPETRVRSEASIATSVPVPIARPRSAWASAGASLTPSPAIATTRPSACRRSTTAALSEGRTSAMTSSIPTSAATAWAVVRLSPVSRTGRRPSSRRRATASAEVGLDRVGDHEDRLDLAVPSGGDRRSDPGARRRAARRRAGRAARSASPRAASGARRRPAWSSTMPSTPEALVVRESRRAPAAAPTRSVAAAAIARAIGCSEAFSSAPIRRSASPLVDARRRPRRRAALISPGGHGAGLVEHDRVDPPGRLQDLRALDQQAELGAATGTDQQRRRASRGRARRGRR